MNLMRRKMFRPDIRQQAIPSATTLDLSAVVDTLNPCRVRGAVGSDDDAKVPSGCG
jgi:hypothetical protein